MPNIFNCEGVSQRVKGTQDTHDSTNYMYVKSFQIIFYSQIQLAGVFNKETFNLPDALHIHFSFHAG